MAYHGSATAQEHTPRTINSTTNNSLNQIAMRDALRRRAQSLIQDKAIDGSSRNIIRYALEINDPMLLELVERLEVEGCIGDNTDAAEDDSLEQKIEALMEIICQTDDHDVRTAALLVLMASVESADDSKSLANAAKTFAFIRCAEMNPYGVVDVQVKMLERELFADRP